MSGPLPGEKPAAVMKCHDLYYSQLYYPYNEALIYCSMTASSRMLLKRAVDDGECTFIP
jgi:hypothetical protein